MKKPETLETKHKNAVKEPNLLPTITETKYQLSDNLKIKPYLEDIEKELVKQLNISKYNAKLILNLFFKSIVDILIFKNKDVKLLKLGKFEVSSFVNTKGVIKARILFNAYKKLIKEIRNDKT